LAIEFAKRGSILILLDMDDNENSKTVDMLKATGLNSKRIYAYHCDLRSREELRAVCDCIRRDVGDVTILINNAGIQSFKSFMECKEEEFMSIMRVNLFASYWLLKEFIPPMLSRNHGHIVSVASSSGLLGFAHMSDNCTSKFALTGTGFETDNQSI
jgi:all-trans-retinol dehydrogenase (NAD+)